MNGKNGLRLLAADSDKAVRRLLRQASHERGYHYFEAATLSDAANQVFQCRPDLMLLDLGLGENGCINLIRGLRQWSILPIIVLSVNEREALKVKVLDSGADDYVVKPFGVPELMARIRAAMRCAARSQAITAHTIGDLSIDWTRRLVTRNHQLIHLTPIEYDILKALAGHSGLIVTHQQLIDEVWGMDSEESLKLLRVHIRNLRSKIEADPSYPMYIVTELGIGYRFCNPDPVPTDYPLHAESHLHAGK